MRERERNRGERERNTEREREGVRVECWCFDDYKMFTISVLRFVLLYVHLILDSSITHAVDMLKERTALSLTASTISFISVIF